MLELSYQNALSLFLQLATLLKTQPLAASDSDAKEIRRPLLRPLSERWRFLLLSTPQDILPRERLPRSSTAVLLLHVLEVTARVLPLLTAHATVHATQLVADAAPDRRLVSAERRRSDSTARGS